MFIKNEDGTQSWVSAKPMLNENDYRMALSSKEVEALPEDRED